MLNLGPMYRHDAKCVPAIVRPGAAIIHYSSSAASEKVGSKGQVFYFPLNACARNSGRQLTISFIGLHFYY